MRLDPRSLEETLGSAAVGLTRPQLLNGVVQPLFEKIGRLWASGRLKIIHEHMASIVTRSFLLDILRTIVVADTSPKIVVGTPVGQWHETGALIVALTAAESGWRPLYFGPNLPAEEIAAAAQITASKAIALSISHRIELEIVVRELSKLRRYCDRQISIYVGGYGISDLKPRVYRRDIRCIESVEDFRSRLEGVC
jgi:methanogenic corrinoid protein MtbC1